MTNPLSRKTKVDELLKKAGVKEPPVSVENLAKILNVRIQRGPLPDDLSGLLYRHKKEESPIIGVNSLHAPVRQRFTIAHELAHFILHKEMDVFVDRNFSVQFRRQKSSSLISRTEVEANQFAGELLMPEEFLKKDLRNKTIDLADQSILSWLTERYKVSLQALLIRLTHLGYLPGL